MVITAALEKAVTEAFIKDFPRIMGELMIIAAQKKREGVDLLVSLDTEERCISVDTGNPPYSVQHSQIIRFSNPSVTEADFAKVKTHLEALGLKKKNGKRVKS